MKTEISKALILRGRALFAMVHNSMVSRKPMPPNWEEDKDALLFDLIWALEVEARELEGYKHVGTTFSSGNDILIRVYAKEELPKPKLLG